MCSDKAPVQFEKMEFPDPVISIAIEPKTKGDQEKLSGALAKMALEDPSFRVVQNEDTGQMLISGMGELHLEIIVDRLLREHKVDANVGKPQVAYKESISTPAKGEGRCSRPVAGKNQFGHVTVELVPLPRGHAPRVVSSVPDKFWPREIQIAVERTLKESLGSGLLVGFPLVDLEIKLTGGSYSEADSHEIAYQVAASQAVKAALEKAKSRLLEPIMKVQILVPEDYMGDVIQDLSARRGRVLAMDPRPGGLQAINAEVPLAQMFGYSTHLRSKSQGRGTFTMEFDRYDLMPESVEKLVLGRLTGLSF